MVCYGIFWSDQFDHQLNFVPRVLFGKRVGEKPVNEAAITLERPSPI